MLNSIFWKNHGSLKNISNPPLQTENKQLKSSIFTWFVYCNLNYSSVSRNAYFKFVRFLF